MNTACQVKYTGTTPGADSNDYTLFDTVVATPSARHVQMGGAHRFYVSLLNTASGTMKMYSSVSRLTDPSLLTSEVTWVQVYNQATSAATTTANTFDLTIEPYADFKVVWTNGGSAQATWLPDMALTSERST